MVVSGEGNIEALPDPSWPEFDGWRVVESPVGTETEVVGGRVIGTRTYGIALIPQSAGALSIPEISYTHFDPATGEYVEAVSAPISIRVAGSDELPAPPAGPWRRPGCGRGGDGHEDNQAGFRHLFVRKVGDRTVSKVYWARMGHTAAGSLGSSDLAAQALGLGGGPVGDSQA